LIPDQRLIWEEKHSEKSHEDLRDAPSPLAVLAEPKFNRESKILELGCGVGRDGVYFDKKDHNVIATDGSQTAIDQDREYFKGSRVKFTVLDMREKLPYGSGTFDVVYANLSLHYYPDGQTKEIVREAARVLKPHGIFAFACKSFDEIHIQGKEIEKNIFVSPKGVAIHFFSKEYAEEILQDLFKTEHLDEVEEEYKGRHSRIVRCIARKN
jgi:SAM-dependent methyltransferase